MRWSRRTWLAGGVAAAAATAGAGWAWWRGRSADASTDTVWDLQFDRPDGGVLAMASLRGRATVLNFWATWCPPCVKEMPELDRFHRDFGPRGWQVVGLAIDGPTPVREFLQRVPVSFPIGLAGLAGTALTKQLGNVSGALPFSVLFDRDGRAVHRKLGETSYAELARWALDL